MTVDIPCRRRRRGYTLLEMLAIIAVMSLLMTIVATTLVAMLRLGSESSERIAWQTTWHRLSLDFRDDVHAARAARSPDGAVSALHLTLSPEAAIEYRSLPHSIERQRFQGEALVATESYRLPEAYAAQLSLADGPHGQTASIALARAAEIAGSPIAVATQPLRIDAHVGRDLRLLSLVDLEEQP